MTCMTAHYGSFVMFHLLRSDIPIRNACRSLFLCIAARFELSRFLSPFVFHIFSVISSRLSLASAASFHFSLYLIRFIAFTIFELTRARGVFETLGSI